MVMRNDSVFNFNFEDRKNEREVTQKFLDSDNYIMMIQGKSGVGKSEFIKVLSSEIIDKHKFLIINKEENISDSYFNIFMKELDKYGLKSILDSDILFEGSAIMIKSAARLSGMSSVDYFIDFILNKSKESLRKKRNNKQEEILLKITENIAKKEQIDVLVFDNFTYCDTESFNIFLPFFHLIEQQKTIKIIIIITEDEHLDYKKMDKLYTRLNLDIHTMEGLPSYKEFMNILRRNISVTSKDEVYIKEIYDECKGNPMQLKIYLTKAISKLNTSVVNKISIKELRNADMNNELPLIELEENSLTQYILFILTSIKKNIAFDLLVFIIRKKFPVIRDITIEKKLNELEKINIIKSNIDNIGNDYYLFTHGSYYYIIKELLEEKLTSYQKLSYDILSLLNENPNIFMDYSINKIDLLEMKAYISYNTKDFSRYSKYIFEYVDYLIDKKLFETASDILCYFKNDYNKLNISEKMKIAWIHYEAGLYKQSLNVLDSFSDNSFNYFYLKTKLYNVLLMKNKDVIYCINKAEEKVKSSKEKNLAINTKILTYLEMPKSDSEYEKQAAELFNNYINEWSNQKIHDPTSAYVLKNAEDFCDLEQAEYYLTEAAKLQIDDMVLHGFINHNLGVVVFRKQKYKQALKLFDDAIENLKNIKPHEISYCLNNKGLIYLLNKEYEQACDLFNEALFWNRSQYTEIAIYSNLMACFCEMNHFTDALAVLKKLQDIIVKNQYTNKDILRKFYTNAAYVNFKCNNITESKQCILKVIEDLPKKSTSAFRINKLIDQLPEMAGYKISDVQIHYTNDIYINAPFDGWIVTLTHD